ncbi:hypothetical protein [Halorubellus sp. PRR65]|uniref:hypothetical protein n=1 Tax=Halorubellus sp. PRR65 TaxID=3098148 RepID=UPI002B25DD43|nr:hypothetical protein [Halorubellus sp. PRR65]
MSGPPSLNTLVTDRSDIQGLRDQLKSLAKQRRDQGDDITVDDMLAMSTKNDPLYVQPADFEKAEWFADIYQQEGEPEIHPRGFHYQILGKGYETRHGDPYENSGECWQELKEAVKWARILGLVDNDQIQDQKNATPTPTAFPSVDDPSPDTTVARDLDASARDTSSLARHVPDGFRPAKIPDEVRPATLSFDDVDALFDAAARALAEHAYEGLYIDEFREQDWYIEIWSEKSDVVPEALAAEYGATIRPAGGGEFSLSMCQSALDIAQARDQDLAVIIVSDFDAKGADMPVSAARKFELEGALRGVDVELVHGAVTLEQVKAYGIPGDPAKTPDGLEDDVRGAKGYETHKELFREFAGQYPVEIRAFQSRYPAAFKTELEERLKQYVDDDLPNRIRDRVRDAQAEAYDALRRAFEEDADDIEAAYRELDAALDRYESRLEDDVAATNQGLERIRDREHAVREAEDVEGARQELREALADVDVRSALDAVDLQLPEPDASGDDDPLLDTGRGLLDQLAAYQDYNIRD